MLTFSKHNTKLSVIGVITAVLGMILLLIGDQGVFGQEQTNTNRVLTVELDTVINGNTARRLMSDLEFANAENYTLVIIQLDTPGGELDATRDIVSDIIASDVPVAVYVSPDGARAASAGTFIASAADFLVMSDVSNIGAASPVDASGGDLEETLDAKVREDAAALLRSIAELRERNSEALEQTVFNATSYTAKEALDLGIADFIATDINMLLNVLDGQQYKNGDVVQTLNLGEVELTERNAGIISSFLSFLSNPSIAYLLIVIGIAGIVIELVSFGLIIPGVIGVVALIFGTVGLWQLPLSWIGVLLLVASAGFFIAEVIVAGIGIFAVLGGVTLALGGIFLIDNSEFIGAVVSVSPWIAIVVAVILVVMFVWFGWEIKKSQRRTKFYKLKVRSSNVEGKIGTVTSDLDPQGEVFVNGEYWTSESNTGDTLVTGTKVKVTQITGLHLRVVAAHSGTPLDDETYLK